MGQRAFSIQRKSCEGIFMQATSGTPTACPRAPMASRFLKLFLIANKTSNLTCINMLIKAIIN